MMNVRERTSTEMDQFAFWGICVLIHFQNRWGKNFRQKFEYFFLDWKISNIFVTKCRWQARYVEDRFDFFVVSIFYHLHRQPQKCHRIPKIAAKIFLCHQKEIRIQERFHDWWKYDFTIWWLQSVGRSWTTDHCTCSSWLQIQAQHCKRR